MGKKVKLSFGERAEAKTGIERSFWEECLKSGYIVGFGVTAHERGVGYAADVRPVSENMGRFSFARGGVPVFDAEHNSVNARKVSLDFDAHKIPSPRYVAANDLLVSHGIGLGVLATDTDMAANVITNFVLAACRISEHLNRNPRQDEFVGGEFETRVPARPVLVGNLTIGGHEFIPAIASIDNLPGKQQILELALS